jgi:hypothetical protein
MLRAVCLAYALSVNEIDKTAKDRFGGDRVAAIDALARIKGPYEFVNMNEYCTRFVLLLAGR